VASKKTLSAQTVDGVLKALLVFSRTVNHVLDSQAVEDAVGVPLSPSKVQIIRLLGNRGKQSSSQVAYFLGVSKPAVSQIIDTMVRDKLVSRRTAEHDRREVELKLTEKGKRWHANIKRQQRHLIRNALRRGTGGKPTLWAKTLEEMTNAVAQADQAFHDFCVQCGAHADGTCVLLGGDADCRFLRPGPAARGPRTGRPAARTVKKRPAGRRKAARA